MHAFVYNHSVVKRTSEQISRIMRRVKGTDTKPELQLRKKLYAYGMRYRVHCQNLTGKPDIVFLSKRIAIFVDGDLWHGNQWRLRGLRSLEEQFADCQNREYWLTKIRRNINRDIRNTARLRQQGWKVIRFWESDVKTKLQACLDTVVRANEGDMDSPVPAAPLTVAEFFAGIGLVRMGLEQAGWETTYANDIDPKKNEMYRAQFSDADAVLDPRNVYDVKCSDISGPVTLATASFPCNDLSLAGARRGLAGQHSSAFWGFLDVIEGLNPRPRMLLLENVPGLLTSHGGSDLNEVLLALNRLGYTVDLLSIDAACFVPQSRRRLFVVAKQETASAEASLPLLLADSVRPPDVLRFIADHPGVAWNIRPLPALPTLRHKIEDIVEVLGADDALWWSRERVDYLLDQMSVRHRHRVDEAITKPVLTYFTVFRRIRNGKSMAEVRSDGIAGCLRTPRGGSGRQILVRVGNGEVRVRLLSARECASLMGATDYKLNVPLNQALFGFGDAVCVPVIKWIAENYLNPYLNETNHATVNEHRLVPQQPVEQKVNAA